jgi:hypothetical protein
MPREKYWAVTVRRTITEEKVFHVFAEDMCDAEEAAIDLAECDKCNPEGWDSPRLQDVEVVGDAEPMEDEPAEQEN